MSEVGKPHHRGAVTRPVSANTAKTGPVTARAGATTARATVNRKPVSEPTAGASQSHIKTKSKINSWLRHHRMMAIDSLWRVLKAPMASLMTWAVLAIAIALPTGLYLFLNNAQLVTSNWDGASQMSLFLKMNVSEQNAEKLAASLRERDDIAAVQYISKQQAMNEFKEFSGFGEALDYLDGNPLPSVLIVRPAALAGNVQQQEQLLRSLQALPEVDEAQLDLAWVKRLYYIMELSQRMVSALAILLGLAVLLVVGNTIRLAIENRRDEIVVVKLVGGTDAFVRRPFLYTGIWYGLGGGLMAWLIINLSLIWLDGPVKALASVYASSFELVGLSSADSITLILSGTLLGWLGAWIAVGRHLGDIEPR